MKLFTILTVFVLFIGFAVAELESLTEEQYENLFVAWMRKYEKTYQHDEFQYRYQIFKTNIDVIRNHNELNAETLGFTMKMNQFGDLTGQEFKAKFTGLNYVKRPYITSQNKPMLNAIKAPSSVDWVSEGMVSDVKNQGSCGSCWSFSTTGAVESANAIAGNQLVTLSEQQLVDCSSSYGNMGCNGGLMDYAFEYIIDNDGLCTESDYPYTASDGYCQSRYCSEAVTISGYKDVSAYSEKSLVNAVASTPVSVAVEADQFSWQFYSTGIIQSNCGDSLDHGVLVAGYGTESGTDFWKVKNSWGEDWGEDGYIRIARGTGDNSGAGTCGILSVPSYPTGARAL